MREIDQNNLHLLLPHKTAGIALRLAEHRNISSQEALLQVYSSDFYRNLEKEAMKLWHYSPAQLFELGFTKHKSSGISRKNGPGRSMLAPYEKQILTAIKAGKTYQTIANELAQEGINTSATNIWKFVRNRKKA